MLFKREEPVFQEVMVAVVSFFGLVHLAWTKIKFNLLSLLQSHSSMGRLTDTLPVVWSLGPAKGLLSDVLAPESISGIWFHPIYDRIPLIVSLYDCSSERDWSGSVIETSWSSESSPSSVYKSTGGRSEVRLFESESLEDVFSNGIRRTGNMSLSTKLVGGFRSSCPV